jgi:hypothetical protein
MLCGGRTLRSARIRNVFEPSDDSRAIPFSRYGASRARRRRMVLRYESGRNREWRM